MTIDRSSVLHDIFSGDSSLSLFAWEKITSNEIGYSEIRDMYSLAYALDRRDHAGDKYMLSMTALFRVMADSMMADNGEQALEYLKEWSAYLEKKIGGDGNE